MIGGTGVVRGEIPAKSEACFCLSHFLLKIDFNMTVTN